MQMPFSPYKGLALNSVRLRTSCGGVLLLLALELLIFLPSMPAVGQVPAASPELPTQRRHTRPSMDDRVRRLAQALDLDEAQRAAVKKILEQRQQQTLRIRRDPSISGSARISQFRALQDGTVERIRAVLNEEQRRKYDPLAVRRTQPAPEQRSVEDWLKATTPQ